MSETGKKVLRDFGEDAREIIGIKVTKSKKTGKSFYSYACLSNYSDYEMENAESIIGSSCEVVGSSIDLGLVVGEIVEFNYGKAIGDYQPIKSVTRLQSVGNPFVNKEK